MKKFDYTKWVTEHKHGILKEQSFEQPGDLDGDGMVNLADLTLVINNWLQSVTPGTNGDGNNDGMVNLADLTLVINNWLQGGGTPPNVGCTLCDPDSWSNYNSWVQQFNSMKHFSSNNPNQPCNMLCKKHQIWDDKCQQNIENANYKNQLSCKYQHGLQLQTQYGCSC